MMFTVKKFFIALGLSLLEYLMLGLIIYISELFNLFLIQIGVPNTSFLKSHGEAGIMFTVILMISLIIPNFVFGLVEYEGKLYAFFKMVIFPILFLGILFIFTNILNTFSFSITDITGQENILNIVLFFLIISLSYLIMNLIGDKIFNFQKMI